MAETLFFKQFADAAQLRSALDLLSPSQVTYVTDKDGNPLTEMRLVEKTLTDNSKVREIVLS